VDLNKSILREFHPLPCVDYQTIAQLAGVKVFSKLDANSGFWRIGLSPKSSKLTTFITPFGQFCFNCLPFGISSVLEHFQKRMSRVLEGTEGFLCQLDDILVFSKSFKEHDEHLKLYASYKRLNQFENFLKLKRCVCCMRVTRENFKCVLSTCRLQG